MGADGHIEIYDAEKLESIIPQAIGYRYEIFGHKVLVRYYGDSPPGYEVPPCLLCGSIDCNDKGHVQKEEEAKSALITKWEVWT